MNMTLTLKHCTQIIQNLLLNVRELNSVHYDTTGHKQSCTRKSGAETFAPLEAVFLAAAFG